MKTKSRGGQSIGGRSKANSFKSGKSFNLSQKSAKTHRISKRHPKSGKLNPEQKLALKMGPDYQPDYFHERGDFKGEYYDRENLNYYRSTNAGLDMGLISNLPVRESLVESLKGHEARDPYNIVKQAYNDNHKTRHYTIGAHSKQHLFGSEANKTQILPPRKEQLFKETQFEMQNEVFPTNFIKKKNEIVGGNKVYEKAFTGMKTYKGDEVQPWMKDNIPDTVQTENIAKFNFSLPNHRGLYNQNLIDSHRSLQKEEHNDTQFANCELRSQHSQATTGMHYRPYEWKYAHDRVVEEDDTTVNEPRKNNSPFSNKHYLPGTTMRRRTDNISLPIVKVNQTNYDENSYKKREPSPQVTNLLNDLRSVRTLQRSGSDIALSQDSGLLVHDNEWEYHKPPNQNYNSITSFSNVSKMSHNRSQKLLPPK